MFQAFVGVVLWTQGDYVLISTGVFDVRLLLLLLRDGTEARLVVMLEKIDFRIIQEKSRQREYVLGRPTWSSVPLGG